VSALRDEVRATLAAAGLSPLHRLGQNFMVDAAALDALVTAALAGTARRMVEIGPGTGIFTRRLLAAGCRVLAVELDRGLAELLREQIQNPGFTLEHGDALAGKQHLNPAIASYAAEGAWQLVSNLPYDVSIPVILNALALDHPPERLVVTIQREAAARLASRPGSQAWGASAAVCAAAAECRILRRLPPQCFYPRPRVDSSLLEVVPQRRLPPGFAPWCRRLFAYRRKRVGRALRDLGLARERTPAVLAAAGIAEDQRVEGLAVGALRELYRVWKETVT